LNQADLVISQTGATGGTRLARCPKEITLNEIYNAVSCGEVFALHGKAPSQDCPIGKNIESVLCNLQKEIDSTIGQKLSEYTLQSVLDVIEQGQG
jgi:DNA-binding IscR family transcriptional regulator